MFRPYPHTTDCAERLTNRRLTSQTRRTVRPKGRERQRLEPHAGFVGLCGQFTGVWDDLATGLRTVRRLRTDS